MKIVTGSIQPTPAPNEEVCWALLAEFLGYAVLSTVRSSGSGKWGSNMGRPDGSTTTIELDEADLRHLLQRVGVL